MAATAITSSCKTITIFPHSHPKPPSLSKQLLYSYNIIALPQISSQISSQSALVTTLSPRSVSSPETSVVEEADDDVSLDSDSLPPLMGCKACGREEIERGCNGEGRIQGGIATVPGFGWWPIKAYRPCPAYVASGGRYRRIGQSMDEVVSGSGSRYTSDGTGEGLQSSNKKGRPKKVER